MWELGHSVKEVERSHQRVVVAETATWGAALLFTSMGLFVLIAFRNGGSVVAATLFLSMALYASVRSTFTADRSRSELAIERCVVLWRRRKVYAADVIEQIYVRSTRKGSGLVVRFTSGLDKNLTMSPGFGYSSLEEAATVLNQCLHRPIGHRHTEA